MKTKAHTSPASTVSTESPAAAAPKPCCPRCGSTDTSFLRNTPNRRLPRFIASVWLPPQKMFVCTNCGHSWIQGYDK